MSEISILGSTWKLLAGHSGTTTVITAASTKVKCGGMGLYKDNLSISIANGSDGSITTATGAGTINATATKIKSEGIFILRKGDKNLVPIVMTGTNPSPPPPTLTYNEIDEVDSAGQK